MTTDLVNAVHDLLEGKIGQDTMAAVVRTSFVSGGANVWEQTGSWLRKLSVEYPSLVGLWHEFATHRSYEVRLRAAASMRDMPAELARGIGTILAGDRSKPVRSLAAEYLQILFGVPESGA